MCTMRPTCCQTFLQADEGSPNEILTTIAVLLCSPNNASYAPLRAVVLSCLPSLCLLARGKFCVACDLSRGSAGCRAARSAQHRCSREGDLGAEQAVSQPPNLVVEPGQVCACGCSRVRGAVRWWMHGDALLLLVATRSYNCCAIFGGQGVRS